MKKLLLFIILVAFVISVLSGCFPSEIEMPYGSDDYKNGEWTAESLIEHFKELGFSNFETFFIETYDEDEVKIYRVAVENSAGSVQDEEYKDFTKGEKLNTWDTIYISANTLIPSLTLQNCSDFADVVQLGEEATEKNSQLDSFMQAHGGEYIKIDGVVTEWNDNYWWIASQILNFSIAIEEFPQTEFSWEMTWVTDLNIEIPGEIGYADYYTGLVSEGQRVHLIAEIVNGEDGWLLEIVEMRLK